ncbi:MAG: hypothetical protein GVY26_00985 [Bacteroidetes bacterium]|jgi:hypothetical protein|nr:hypothetical protein [Bacteroidota bacterium]
MNDGPSSTWSKTIPWFLTIASVLALLSIGYFLIQNVEWYKDTVFEPGINDVECGAYRMRAYDLHLSMVKRSVGLFSGFAVMFLGLGVAFYTLRSNTELSADTQGFKLSLLTASPGIVAILVGGAMIILTIQSKDSFGRYKAPCVKTEEVRKRLQESAKEAKEKNGAPSSTTPSSETSTN